MRSSRLEAFSDGVLAIIITIMVLELKLPDSGAHSFHDFFHATGLSLLTYLLSFIYIGIYWNNHHHMFQIVEDVDAFLHQAPGAVDDQQADKQADRRIGLHPAREISQSARAHHA